MKKDFQEASCEAPTLYFGRIVEIAGDYKLEWTDPHTGTPMLLSETDLVELEKESRLSLCRGDCPAGGEDWQRLRNKHYSAEYGLAALQRHKLSRLKSLDTPYRPVIPD